MELEQPKAGAVTITQQSHEVTVTVGSDERKTVTVGFDSLRNWQLKDQLDGSS